MPKIDRFTNFGCSRFGVREIGSLFPEKSDHLHKHIGRESIKTSCLFVFMADVINVTNLLQLSL